MVPGSVNSSCSNDNRIEATDCILYDGGSTFRQCVAVTTTVMVLGSFNSSCSNNNRIEATDRSVSVSSSSRMSAVAHIGVSNSNNVIN